jgi:hypothetical protein
VKSVVAASIETTDGTKYTDECAGSMFQASTLGNRLIDS